MLEENGAAGSPRAPSIPAAPVYRRSIDRFRRIETIVRPLRESNSARDMTSVVGAGVRIVTLADRQRPLTWLAALAILSRTRARSWRNSACAFVQRGLRKPVERDVEPAC